MMVFFYFAPYDDLAIAAEELPRLVKVWQLFVHHGLLPEVCECNGSAANVRELHPGLLLALSLTSGQARFRTLPFVSLLFVRWDEPLGLPLL